MNNLLNCSPRLSVLFLPLIVALSGACTIYQDEPRDDPPRAFQADAGPAPGLPDAQPTSGPDGGQRLVDAGPVPVTDAGNPWVENDAGPGQDCAAIAVEALCVVNADCRPLYEGIDCRCFGDGSCECDSWAFDRCD